MRSLVPREWGPPRVRTTIVVGYPFNADGKLCRAGSNRHYPRWENKTVVVAEVFYPSDLPGRERSFRKGISLACAERLSKYEEFTRSLREARNEPDAYVIYVVVSEHALTRLVELQQAHQTTM